MDRKDFRFEFKEVAESGTFEGLASTWTKDLMGDVIEQGAFARSIKNQKNTFPVLWQHDWDEPIGVIKAADMAETDKGLQVKGTLFTDGAVPRADHARTAAQGGALGGMSIGFEIPRNKVVWDETTQTRRIKEVKLWEVSLVTFPANPKAKISGVKELNEGALARCMEALRTLDETEESKARAIALLEDVTALLKAQTDPDSDSPGPADDSSDSLTHSLEALVTRLETAFKG